jgi:EAL and modified HD-GYP domain-containing signal transduction protein
MPEPYFFIRPILAADQSWAAFDWQSGALFTNDCTDLERCFNESAATPLARLLPIVVPIDPQCIEQSGFVEGFDARQVVFILPAATLDNAQSLARCKQLRSQGYRFGLHINRTDLIRQVPVAAFNYLWLDAAFARQDLPANDLNYAVDAGFRKIATRVGSHEMFGWLTEKKFDWCDSHFLTVRNPLAGPEPDLTRLKLLKLLNLVRQDGDTREIEGIFREEPKLSYNLLRLVNSVAVGARTRISNFSQAIAILGRRQLQRWLQLLIYADNLAGGTAPNPLMQLAAARGRLMELLSVAIVPEPDIPDLSDNAFMTGLFSLLDVLINLPIKEILKELPLQPEVVDALSSPTDDGILGHLLSAILAGESGNFSDAEAILSDLGISSATHAKSQVTALYWAARINIENHD